MYVELDYYNMDYDDDVLYRRIRIGATSCMTRQQAPMKTRTDPQDRLAYVNVKVKVYLSRTYSAASLSNGPRRDEKVANDF